MAKKVLVEMPDDLADALDKLAEKQGESRSTMIRIAVREKLEREAQPPKEK